MKWQIRLDASKLLFDNGFYSEAIIFCWQILRAIIFDFLCTKEIRYDSTKEALKEAVKYLSNKDINYGANLCFFETIATLLEWDENKAISKNEGEELRTIFLELIENFK